MSRRSVLLLLSLQLLLSCASWSPGFVDGEGELRTPDGVTLHYRVAGVGSDVIVLLHGGPGSNMNAVYPDLAPLSTRHRIIMYDQRGGGRSEPIADTKQLTAANHVRDLEMVRNYFHLKRFTLIGESWGSGLAALYAAQYPQYVSKIVFLGPMPPTKEMSKQRLDSVNAQMGLYQRMGELRKAMTTAADPIAACREFFAAYLPPYFANPEAMNRRKGDPCDTSPAGARNYIAINDATIASLGEWDFRPLLASLKMPTMVIEGQESRPTLAGARAWAAAIPNARLVLIPNSGHFPQVENPEAFFAAVEQFVNN